MNDHEIGDLLVRLQDSVEAEALGAPVGAADGIRFALGIWPADGARWSRCRLPARSSPQSSSWRSPPPIVIVAS